MRITSKIDPIDRDIALMLDDLSPAAQSAALAEFARDQRDEALEVNARALGAQPEFETFVDGGKSNDLSRVRPNGRIVFEFELFREMLGWIDLQLIKHSPVGRTGKYRRSHVLFADGVEVDSSGNAPLPDAREFIYLNTVPYARRIEEGWSKQARDGVYHGVATLAAGRFGNLAKISFEHRRVAGAATVVRNDWQPAIVITV